MSMGVPSAASERNRSARLKKSSTIFFWPVSAQNHVDVFGPRVALIVGVHVRFVAVQRESALDGEYVAGVAVDVHVFRI